MSESQDPKASSQVKEGEHTTNDVASLSIDHLRLGVRARNCLADEKVALIGDLVRKNEYELLRIPHLGKLTLREIKAALCEWGLSPGMSATEISSASKDPRASLPLVFSTADTPRDEFIDVIRKLLADFASGRECFIAYHGLEDGHGRTLDEVSRKRLGFDRQVSRERVRQVMNQAQRILRRESARVRFHCWTAATKRAQEALPMPLHRFLSCFGFESVVTATGLFGSLKRCASIFGLDFPFALQRSQQGEDLVLVCRTESLFVLDAPFPWKRTS